MTAPWVDRPFLAVDCETTGVDAFSDRLVEVAVVRVLADGTSEDAYRTIVNPGVEIPAGAAEIHGITTERAIAEGVSTVEAITEVARRVFETLPEGLPIVMFNARFDWPLLISEAERHGLEFPAFAPVLDPYLIDRICDKYRKGGRKLLKVCAHYEVPLEEADAHGALADAIAAARVMRQIITRYPKVGERSLASTFVRQVRGHAVWRYEFIEYKHRKGDLNFDMPHGWPIPAGPLPAPLPATDAVPAAAEAPPADPIPSGQPADGKEAAASGDPVASEPTPEERSAAVSISDVARYSTTVFRADYDAAPKGDKTKVVERLRHAMVFAMTDGRALSLNDVTPEELVKVHATLRRIADGQVHYSHDDDGVTFVFPATGQERSVQWVELLEVAA